MIFGPKISHSQATMIKKSFSICVFPSKLKLGKVVPIYQMGNPEIPSNHRPISLSPIIMEI